MQLITEKRSMSFDVRAEQNNRYGTYLYGVPIVFNQKVSIGGYYYEVIMPGALDHTNMKDVRFLIGHDDKSIPLARSRNNNGNSTMQLMVTQRGLEIRVNLDTENNVNSRMLYSAVERGDITGMSFAFTVDGDEWQDIDSEQPTRIVRSIKQVYEVSAVAFPAYDQTIIDIDSSRSQANNREESQKRKGAIQRLNYWRQIK